MKKLIFVCILCLGCLKTQKSPFDISNPSGSGAFGAFGISISESNSSSSSSGSYTLTSISYTPSTNVFAVGVAITNMVPTVIGTAESYSISPLASFPAGLSFDTTTGIISGTPTTVDVTPITFTITATNTTSSVSANITLSVVTALSGFSYSGVTITGGSTNTLGGIVTISATRSVDMSITPAISGTSPSYSVSPSLPAGLSLSGTTGTISGAPTTVQSSASYTLTATNSVGSSSVTINIIVRPLVIVATWGGGLGISIDGGQTYTMRTNAINGVGCDNINSVFIDSSYKIFTANGQCGSQGISVSLNHGSTFSTTMLTAYQITAINVPSSTQIFAGSLHTTNALSGLQVSINSGGNFNQIAQSNFDTYHIKDIFISGSNIYVANGLSSTGGISISTNNGLTFPTKLNTINNLPANPVNGVFVSGSTIYAATTSGLYKSINGGTSFSATSVTGSTNKVKISSNGNVFVATPNGFIIYYPITDTNTLVTSGLSGIYVTNIFEYQDGTIYISTSGGVSISNNGGNSFTTYTSGLTNTSLQDIFVK